jgi:hypothetical protein
MDPSCRLEELNVMALEREPCEGQIPILRSPYKPWYQLILPHTSYLLLSTVYSLEVEQLVEYDGILYHSSRFPSLYTSSFQSSIQRLPRGAPRFPETRNIQWRLAPWALWPNLPR